MFTAGDEAYPNGSASNFSTYYEPTWGRFKSRTRPVAGNHEYVTPGASAHYAYFGSAAGDPAKGYYSYNLGGWHVVALNSNCSAVGGCNAGSAQEKWLRADLAANSRACTFAYWHHPRFTSGANHAPDTSVSPWCRRCTTTTPT
ncbi:metallophosphoesterase family protein [Streptosporangium lutulentum]